MKEISTNPPSGGRGATRLKILSLWQPHATLCITPSLHNPEIPAKPVETRHWATQFTGWLGVHAALKKDPQYKYLAGESPFTDYIKNFDQLPFGYIIGMVYISNCFATDGLSMNAFIEKVADEDQPRMDEIRAFGNFSPNRYGFIIEDFVAFTTPIRASGSQGFWYYDMPHDIGARVWTKHDGFGIILDYREDTAYNYLIKLDNDGTKQWYSQSAFGIAKKVISDGHNWKNVS